jgi:hypothetical protein
MTKCFVWFGIFLILAVGIVVYFNPGEINPGLWIIGTLGAILLVTGPILGDICDD